MSRAFGRAEASEMQIKYFADSTERNAYNVTAPQRDDGLIGVLLSDATWAFAIATGASSSVWSDPFNASDLTAIQARATTLESNVILQVGPFSVTTAADQTDAATTHGVSGGAWVAPWAGYIVAVSGYLSAAVTGASQSVTIEVDVDGSQLAGVGLSFTQAGAETEASQTITYGTAAAAVAADERVSLVYTSDTITNTPDFVGHVIFAKTVT